MEILCPASRVPVLTTADVIVVGGGVAGVTAAVSAARHGASVVLLERWSSVGGMATNGLVNGWHRSDREKVVINGLVQEAAARAEAEGWLFQVDNYPKAHETHWFDPEGMRLVYTRMLAEANVTVICYIAAGDPIVEGDRITAVLVDTKTGRKAVTGSIFVDASGDGDVAAKAGIPFSFGRESDGRVQGMTEVFALSGVDWLVARRHRSEITRVMAEMKQARERGELPPYNEGNTRASLELGFGDRHGFFYWNVTPVAGNPLDESELTALTNESRERVFAHVAFWRRHMPGFENARVSQTAPALGIRESRRIACRTTLTADMVLSAAKQQDAIGHGVWIIDIHDPEGSGHTTFSDHSPTNMLASGTSYHIPFGMCVPAELANLGVVGRCASSTHRAHSSVRVQTHCMVMGQGVGTAAALALDSSVDLSDVDMSRLQNTLRTDGAYLRDIPTG